ncbi:MAG TPA: ABC transporter substrate-binding protein [Candidatus Binatia bacterium]|jgi:multiple sugar transport system substrate-binding protein|nr:ABC transporter substrate-binding protein [Candidatus Binatia bacterium]
MLNAKKFFCLAFFLCLYWPTAWAQNTELRVVTWKAEAPKVWDQAVADFERQNSGIKIVREIAPQSSTQIHDLLTQKLKNRDPRLDVFFMDTIWPAEFASAGWALPLDRYFTAAERDKFLPAPILANQYRGQIFGVPLFVDAGVLYYRKDLLQKYALAPPRTWPELVEEARTILAREHGLQLVGFSGQFKQYEGLVCNMMEYILSGGGALWDEKRMVSALHEPAALEAVRFVRDRIIGEISHRGVLSYEEPESLALFTQGRAIFHRNWPYAWSIANDPASSKIAGKVGMMPLPGFPGGKGVAALGGWQLGVSRFSRRPDLAWRFVAFMTSDEIQKRIALATGRGPTRTVLYEDAELTVKMPQLKSLLETFKQAVPRPTTPVYVPLSNVMQRYFSSVLALPNTEIKKHAALAARDMDRLLDLLRERQMP